jgi:hypothetical protein
MRLSVNLIANQTFFPMESEVPDEVVPKAIAAKYRLAPGQGAMRAAEPGATGSFVPGVAYRVSEDGTLIRDEETRRDEEVQTARWKEVDEENWRRSGLMGPGISDATMEAQAIMENSSAPIVESELQGAQLPRPTHCKRGINFVPLERAKLQPGEQLFAQVNETFVRCGKVSKDKKED